MRTPEKPVYDPFGEETEDEWKARMESVYFDGHAVLLDYQPQIRRALKAEHATEDAGRRLDPATHDGAIIAACVAIYRYPVGSDAHKDATRRLMESAANSRMND